MILQKDSRQSCWPWWPTLHGLTGFVESYPVSAPPPDQLGTNFKLTDDLTPRYEGGMSEPTNRILCKCGKLAVRMASLLVDGKIVELHLCEDHLAFVELVYPRMMKEESPPEFPPPPVR